MSWYLRETFQLGSKLFSSSSTDDETTAANGLPDQEPQTYDEEFEQTQIITMKAQLQTQLSSSKDVDDLTLRRFLRARDLDIEKASDLLIKYLNWRKEFVPNGCISRSDIPNELAQNKIFMQGHDKLGRPIVVTFGAQHRQTSLEEFKRFVTFTLDKVCSSMPNGQEKFVCISDLEGWGYANSDVRGYIAALSILQDCYPERLGKLYNIHVPSMFMTAWKMIYPFIDSKTTKKIVFVEDKDLESTLLVDVEESQLPVTYGGRLALVPIQDC